MISKHDNLLMSFVFVPGVLYDERLRTLATAHNREDFFDQWDPNTQPSPLSGMAL
jgi:hypothetical protein